MTLKTKKIKSHNFTRLCGAVYLCPLLTLPALTVSNVNSAFAASLGGDVNIGRMKSQSGIKRGSWLFLPSISNGLLYDTNLFGDSNSANIQDELIAFSVPKVVAVKSFSGGSVSLDFESVMARYLYDDTNSYTNLKGGISGQYELTPRISVSGASNLQTFSEIRSSTNQDSVQNALEPITGVSFSTNVSLSFNRNRFSHSLEAGYARKDYNAALVNDGGNIVLQDQDVKNTESYSLSKSLNYTFSRFVKVYGAGNIDWSYAPNNPVRDVTSYTVNAGVDITWTSKLASSFNYSLSKDDFHNAPDSELLPAYEASLKWTPNAKFNMSITATHSESGRNFEEGSSSGVTESISGALSYLVSKNLSFNAGSSFSKSEFTSTGTKTVESRNLELSTQYAINRNTGLTIGYTYTERESTEANDSFEKETIQGNIVSKF